MQKVAFLIIVSSLASFSAIADCKLTMVYKEGGKAALIAKTPDDSGVYQDMFSEAASRIGCALEIKRLPKKRLHSMLEAGEVDFYPGASFSKKRAHYLGYIANGLETAEWGLTNAGAQEINSYQDLQNRDIYWLMEPGSSKTQKAQDLGITTKQPKDLNIQKVSEMSEKLNFFYVADKELIDYFTKDKSLKESNLMVHKNCCGGDSPMYMGFSVNSPNFAKQPNPNYDPNLPLSPENSEYIPGADSVAAKLGKALLDMRNEGVLSKIYERHFNKTAD